MIITITGRMGSGKDTFLSLLSIPKNYIVINADEIGHTLLSDRHIIKQIQTHFPSAVTDGSVNRKKLAELVFPDQITTLNSIIHPAITKEILRKLTKNSIINAALLDELSLEKLSDKVIFIDSKIDIVIQRLKNKFSKTDILNRLKTQKPLDWYFSHSDIIINNNGSIDDLKIEIETKCRNLF